MNNGEESKMISLRKRRFGVCGAWWCFFRKIFIIIINSIFQGEKTGEKEQKNTFVVGQDYAIGGGDERSHEYVEVTFELSLKG